MSPVAFQIGSFEIRWYGVLISFGVILAILLAGYNCQKKNIDFDLILDGFFVAFPAAIIGARMYYVVFEFENYKNNLIDMFNIRKGGLAIHGGLIGAFLAIYVFSKVRKIAIVKYLDVAAPSIILAQAIGRWGNFMNGEAHGGEVSYGFISHFPNFIQRGMNIGETYYNPTFLYESIWNIIVCIILLVILYKKRNQDNGIVIASYMVLYSLGRVVIEGLRTDSLMLGNIRVAQLVSITGIIIGIWIIICIKRKNNNFMMKS
jgi:phosphatidylglycerol:prolipoprotein diacylglycerol transferase